MGLGGAFGGLLSLATGEETPLPGIKIGTFFPPGQADDDWAFLRHAGVEYVSVWTSIEDVGYEAMMRTRRLVEANGIRVYNIGITDLHCDPTIVLGLKGVDKKIDQYRQYLRNLGKAGIHYTTYAHMGNGIWSSERETTRGGASARAFHQSTAKGHWAGEVFENPLSHGRKFSKEELWENWEYFIKQVVPVAEEAGVRIGVHPDDPPVPELAGVPRHMFGTFDGYVKAFEIANSSNVGICLCCGTWMEGGAHTGKNVLDAAREFAKMDKLWKIHFRNVTGPIPDFVETYVDDGYTDMKQLMRTLVDVDFRGILIADHVPAMVGDRKTGWAYSLGYIKALYEMAKEERGRA
jgi:mannonate dehydratase